MDSVRLGLIGLGTVGCGVINLLAKHGQTLADRSGVKLKITRAAAKGFSKKRDADLAGIALSMDPFEIVQAKDVDIVIEVMGGENPALELILEAIKNGKHVVTANKRLLAVHGEKIYKAVEDAGVELGFEAAVAGAVPVIRSIREAFAANKIEAVHGIINGTSNYILSRMKDEGKPFGEILKDAQELGYAEADPTFDVEGIDSAHKIAVLAALAFQTPVDFAGVYTEGISKITPEDIGMAKEFGYTIKLLAIAKRVNDSIDVRVHPAMIPSSHPMANVNGPLNAVEVIGDSAGVNMLVGPGAGAGPTASAVMGDALDIAARMARGTAGKRPPLAIPSAMRKKIKMRPIGEARSRYYIRFSVPDRPGVLAQLAGALGESGISIASMIQRGREENTPVSVVMTTHVAVESDLRKALAKVDTLKVNAAPAMVIRMEGE
ncbi:MAG: homoserine dehydrogenase [Nitrospinae bacterium]|nr:homoserine dehydrogenase [Nitrospinota bacterium]